MRTDVFRFTFDPDIDMLEVEATFQLAIIATEGLFGEARTRTDVLYLADAPRHALVADGGTPGGSAVIRIFTAFITREFGADAFHVRRMPVLQRDGGAKSVGIAA